MKAHPAWAGRAVKPRSRNAVREAQGLTARTSPKPSFAGTRSATRADAVRLIKSRIIQINTAADLNWRVMAQVSLGEVLACPDARAYSAINSKRVDLLVVSRRGDPIVAIEYQGHGHYQGTAAARDAITKEALRKAGIQYIEVTPESGTEDMARELSRMAQAERLKPVSIADAHVVTLAR